MVVPDRVPAPLRVAILSGSSRQRDRLGEILENHGIQVVGEETLSEQLPALSRESVDVLLVDLDHTDGLDQQMLDALVAQSDVPVLFNEGAVARIAATASGQAWGRRLASKVAELAQDVANRSTSVVTPELRVIDVMSGRAGETVVAEFNDAVRAELEHIHGELGALVEQHDDEMFVDLAVAEAAEPASAVVEPDGDLDGNEAQIVWVLGASIGGPQAVKEFIRALPVDLPIGFVLAQHIGAGFVTLLARQLARVTDLEVSCAEDGMRVRKGQLVVAPAEERIVFDDRGRMELQPVVQRSVYSPSIDAVMCDVVSYFGSNTGAIVFSGMGSDGLKGCRAICEQGGVVWAQDAASCVISSMADAVRTAGLASHSASPTALAEALLEHLKRSAA